MDVIPIKLRDESAEIEVSVNYLGFNIQERKFIVDSLTGVNVGDTLYYPILRKGRLITGAIMASSEDHRIYLDSFMRYKFGGMKGSLQGELIRH